MGPNINAAECEIFEPEVNLRIDYSQMDHYAESMNIVLKERVLDW